MTAPSTPGIDAIVVKLTTVSPIGTNNHNTCVRSFDVIQVGLTCLGSSDSSGTTLTPSLNQNMCMNAQPEYTKSLWQATVKPAGTTAKVQNDNGTVTVTFQEFGGSDPNALTDGQKFWVIAPTTGSGGDYKIKLVHSEDCQSSPVCSASGNGKAFKLKFVDLEPQSCTPSSHTAGGSCLCSGPSSILLVSVNTSGTATQGADQSMQYTLKVVTDPANAYSGNATVSAQVLFQHTASAAIYKGANEDGQTISLGFSYSIAGFGYTGSGLHNLSAFDMASQVSYGGGDYVSTLSHLPGSSDTWSVPWLHDYDVHEYSQVMSITATDKKSTYQVGTTTRALQLQVAAAASTTKEWVATSPRDGANVLAPMAMNGTLPPVLSVSSTEPFKIAQ